MSWFRRHELAMRMYDQFHQSIGITHEPSKVFFSETKNYVTIEAWYSCADWVMFLYDDNEEVEK